MCSDDKKKFRVEKNQVFVTHHQYSYNKYLWSSAGKKSQFIRFDVQKKATSFFLQLKFLFGILSVAGWQILNLSLFRNTPSSPQSKCPGILTNYFKKHMCWAVNCTWAGGQSGPLSSLSPVVSSRGAASTWS